MTVPARQLTFSAVDGLGFAAARGELDAAQQTAPYVPNSLGPLLELMDIEAGGQLPPRRGRSWLAQNGATEMISALQGNGESWVNPDGRRTGFIRAVRSGVDGDNRLVAFLMEAKRAASEVAHLPGTTPGQLTAAMQELENNIHEHSGAPATGFLAFRAASGIFEFVVADRGIGMLASLRRRAAFSALENHGTALQAALTDGTSRYESAGHGHGFRPIFIGLANLQGYLRFRSGDHALVMDGRTPTLATARISQKPLIGGFFASVCCRSEKALDIW
jgi:hypothetical protein